MAYNQAYGIRQVMLADTHLTDTDPDVVGVYDNITCVLEYLGCSTGGKFAFADANVPPRRGIAPGVHITRIFLSLPGNQDTWTINISDATGTYNRVWLSGTTDTDILYEGEDAGMFLGPNEIISITTTGAGLTGTIWAEVLYRRSNIAPVVESP